MNGNPYCGQCWPFKTATDSQEDEAVACPTCEHRVIVDYGGPVIVTDHE